MCLRCGGIYNAHYYNFMAESRFKEFLKIDTKLCSRVKRHLLSHSDFFMPEEKWLCVTVCL